MALQRFIRVQEGLLDAISYVLPGFEVNVVPFKPQPKPRSGSCACPGIGNPHWDIHLVSGNRLAPDPPTRVWVLREFGLPAAVVVVVVAAAGVASACASRTHR